jgi:hypothetical protein
MAQRFWDDEESKVKKLTTETQRHREELRKGTSPKRELKPRAV